MGLSCMKGLGKTKACPPLLSDQSGVERAPHFIQWQLGQLYWQGNPLSHQLDRHLSLAGLSLSTTGGYPFGGPARGFCNWVTQPWSMMLIWLGILVLSQSSILEPSCFVKAIVLHTLQSVLSPYKHYISLFLGLLTMSGILMIFFNVMINVSMNKSGQRLYQNTYFVMKCIGIHF